MAERYSLSICLNAFYLFFFIYFLFTPPLPPTPTPTAPANKINKNEMRFFVVKHLSGYMYPHEIVTLIKNHNTLQSAHKSSSKQLSVFHNNNIIILVVYRHKFVYSLFIFMSI